MEEKIRSAGFDSWAICGVEPLTEWLGREGVALERDVRVLAPEAKSLLIVAKYIPMYEKEGGVAAYYIESSRAHQAAAALAKELGGVHVTHIPLRTAALRAGLGSVGENQLMIHPESGTAPHVQAIALKEKLPAGSPLKAAACLHCGACRRACPTGALNNGFDAQKCLRTHMGGNAPAPVELRKAAGIRVLGCESCQRACPLLHARQPGEAPEALSIKNLLTSTQPEQVYQLLGKNTNFNRLRAAAAIAAGNSGNTEFLPVLKALSGHQSPALSEAAAWAATQLEVGT